MNLEEKDIVSYKKVSLKIRDIAKRWCSIVYGYGYNPAYVGIHEDFIEFRSGHYDGGLFNFDRIHISYILDDSTLEDDAKEHKENERLRVLKEEEDKKLREIRIEELSLDERVKEYQDLVKRSVPTNPVFWPGSYLYR